MSFARRISSLALVIAPWAPMAAQSVPSVALSKPEVEFAEPFDQVTAVRELSDGRVIVADLLAKAVSLTDLRRGTATAIGREGQGPGEFGFPAGLIAQPGDTTLLVDPAQRRFLKIAPNGKPTGTVPFPTAAGGLMNVRGADRQGRIYLQGSLFGGGPLGGDADARIPDSVAIVRWTPGRDRLDTLGRVKIPSTARATSGSQGARAVVMRQQPFSPSDDWSVTPEGRVGVARVGTYHVEWLGSPPAKGKPVGFSKIPVTQADKDLYNQRANDPRGRLMISEGGGGGRGANLPPPQLGEPDWPGLKPPFVSNSVRAAPDGSLWVQRSQPAGAAPLYDVFDASGALVKQVRLEKNSRLVGFGAASVYVARTDGDELQHLQRFKRP